MSARSLNMVFGFKAICLLSSLNDSDRRVAAAILDHYNHKTGQCDPSLDTIAFLVGLSRRTVIRCVNTLVRLGFFRRIRHGGNFHRNFYEPGWQFFEQVEIAWKRRRKENTLHRRHMQRLSQSPSQPRHSAGDSSDTQTFLTNISDGTFRDVQPKIKHSSDVQRFRVLPRKMDVFRPKQISSRTAAYDAAERRWNIALQEQYLNQPVVYARIVELIDQKLHQAATEAEVQRHGAGLPYIVEQLRGRRDGDSTPGDLI